MPTDFKYCPHCESGWEGEPDTEHGCDEAKWAAAMPRHDLEDSRGWEGGYSGMGPDEQGEWVRWEDVVRLLRSLKGGPAT